MFNMSSFLDRTTVDPLVCHGRQCVKGTRVMVWVIYPHCRANGDDAEDILSAYPEPHPRGHSGVLGVCD
jgi:uncharacterized protein (DUF433 family)